MERESDLLMQYKTPSMYLMSHHQFMEAMSSMCSSGQPQADAWTVQRLVDACSRKAIDYEERVGYDRLLGVVITVFGSSLISVKAMQPETDKIFTIAHELGHIALGHHRGKGFVHYLYQLEDSSMRFYDDPDQEQAAHIWAAHLLVRPDMYEQALQEMNLDEELAAMVAAQRLNIPVQVVKLWREYREWVFPEEPLAWLGHP